MSTTFDWAGWTSRGTVLTTELNSLANVTFSGVTTVLDNITNKDQWASVMVALASLTPTTGAYLSMVAIESMDGTNFEDLPIATGNWLYGSFAASNSVFAAAGTKLVKLGPFRLMPSKYKFSLFNAAGVALASSGNTATLYTTNEVGV